jgi:hypothetical protein
MKKKVLKTAYLAGKARARSKNNFKIRNFIA